MAFTGRHLLRTRCLHCSESRFSKCPDNIGDFFPSVESYSHLKPRAVFLYIPLIPRLKLLYANKESSAKMRYPGILLKKPAPDKIRDIWDGDMMKELRDLGSRFLLLYLIVGYFEDERTVCLQFSTDGVQLFKNSSREAWPFLVINDNLDPTERYSIFIII
jgi:hypothetical protein